MPLPESDTNAFICAACGFRRARLTLRCPTCRKYHTMRPFTPPPMPPIDLPAAEEDEDEDDGYDLPRISTGSAELDRVLGCSVGATEEDITWGSLPGFVYMLSGEPGAGKSTLLMQASIAAAKLGDVLYATGEEQEKPVRMRAIRLGLEEGSEVDDHLQILVTNSTDDVRAAALARPPLVIVADSASVFQSSKCEGQAGGVTQVKQVGHDFVAIAQETGAVVFLIVHLTKAGDAAGPNTLKHLVDAYLMLGHDGSAGLRSVRAAKNRGGTIDEVATFEMQERGMVDVPNPSAIMLRERRLGHPGSVVAAVLPGSSTRARLVEVQALVGEKNDNRAGKRSVQGVETARVSTIIAILTHEAPMLGLEIRDIHVNVIGGLAITETAIDAAIAVAIVSSAEDTPVDEKVAVFGELGLQGEVRSCGAPNTRLNEAAKADFDRLIMPAENARSLEENGADLGGVEIIAARTLLDLLHLTLYTASDEPRRTKATAVRVKRPTAKAKPKKRTKKKPASEKKKGSDDDANGAIARGKIPRAKTRGRPRP